MQSDGKNCGSSVESPPALPDVSNTVVPADFAGARCVDKLGRYGNAEGIDGANLLVVYGVSLYAAIVLKRGTCICRIGDQ